MKEYYVIQESAITGPSQARRWELKKYNENSQLLAVGVVTELHNGNFESDDIAFQQHRNQRASRRIRIVKEHLKKGEPLASCYWIDKGRINCFKV